MKAVIVAGGELHPADRAQLADADLVLAADAGAQWLADQGLTPHILVGDMDSIPAALLARLEGQGVAIERHSADKEASDAELAVERAVAAGAHQIVLIGALGGERLDHELANLLLAADEAWLSPSHELSIVRGQTRVRAVRGGARVDLHGGAGDLVTLLPISGDAEGVRTNGLRFALTGEPLRMGRSRGLSNVIESPPASVSVDKGMLLVIETSEKGAGR
ncbi:MAG: thiamine diphosphokinase [Chloroflexi bacterium]|nr:MAG: thiamine diphosphokinase [Chloroflexota bacterium]